MGARLFRLLITLSWPICCVPIINLISHGLHGPHLTLHPIVLVQSYPLDGTSLSFHYNILLDLLPQVVGSG